MLSFDKEKANTKSRKEIRQYVFINRKRSRGYKFTEKTHSKRGIIATVLALMLLILYGAFTYLAFHTNGALSMYYGGTGVIALFLSLIGSGIALRSLREEDSFHLFPRLGLFLSIVNVACWVSVYLSGMYV